MPSARDRTSCRRLAVVPVIMSDTSIQVCPVRASQFLSAMHDISRRGVIRTQARRIEVRAISVVDQDRRAARHDIVRVLRDPSLPAFSQVKRYSAIR